MTRRTRGREIALQVLYQLEQNPDIPPEEVRQFLERRLHDPALRAYADWLIVGVRKHQSHVDSLISRVAQNWAIERMAAIDRNILRLAALEMFYGHEVPINVVINEALDLAKRYSTAQSSRFVNGLLDHLHEAAEQARSEQQPPGAADPNGGSPPPSP